MGWFRLISWFSQVQARCAETHISYTTSIHLWIAISTQQGILSRSNVQSPSCKLIIPVIGFSSCLFVRKHVRGKKTKLANSLLLYFGAIYGNYSFIPFDQGERFLAAHQLVFRLYLRLLQAKGLIDRWSFWTMSVLPARALPCYFSKEKRKKRKALPSSTISTSTLI